MGEREKGDKGIEGIKEKGIKAKDTKKMFFPKMSKPEEMFL
jgi:hypothetical protein